MPILIIPSNQRSKIQRNISQCYGMFIHENASENVVRKMVAIFFRLQFPQSTLTRPCEVLGRDKTEEEDMYCFDNTGITLSIYFTSNCKT